MSGVPQDHQVSVRKGTSEALLGLEPGSPVYETGALKVETSEGQQEKKGAERHVEAEVEGHDQNSLQRFHVPSDFPEICLIMVPSKFSEEQSGFLELPTSNKHHQQFEAPRTASLWNVWEEKVC